MEDKKIIIKELPQDLLDFISMPAGIEKAVLYKSKWNSHHGSISANIKIENGYIYFSRMIYGIKKGKNNNFYLKAEKKQGLTIDPKGKLQVWFSSNIMVMFGSFANLRDDFLRHISPKYIPSIQFGQFKITFFTATMISKIVTGKITSDLELVEAWLKNKRIKMSPKILLNMLKACHGKYNFDSFIFDDYKLSRMLFYVDNPDAFANMVIKSTEDKNELERHSSELYPYHSMRLDMIEQAEILGKTLNYKWSYNRMREEHEKWTEELLSYEVKYLEERTQKEQPWHKYFDDLIDKETVGLVTTKEIYKEASLMSHCLYTNYKDRILSGNVLCYHTTKGGVDGTLTLHISQSYTSQTPYVELMQFYGKRNAPMPKHITEYYEHKVMTISNEIPLEDLKNINKHEEEYQPF